MSEIKINVENCNNISHGELMLEENKLNIKYGMHETGKSILSTAISLISRESDLTELKPFGSGEAVVPKINLSKNIQVVKVFNEDIWCLKKMKLLTMHLVYLSEHQIMNKKELN